MQHLIKSYIDVSGHMGLYLYGIVSIWAIIQIPEKSDDKKWFKNKRK